MTVLAQYGERKVWTRDEVAKLDDFFEGQRYELIEGDLINKMGQKPPPAYFITLLSSILSEAFPGRVRVQSPITLPDPLGVTSEPEPDVVVLRRESSEFFRRHPGPEEVALLIEVSDRSFRMDREIKGRLYARSGIKLYWIVDVQGRRVIVLEGPGDEYKSVRIYERDERVPLIEGVTIPVESLFGVE